jgi:hypothetical protein
MIAMRLAAAVVRALTLARKLLWVIVNLVMSPIVRRLSR